MERFVRWLEQRVYFDRLSFIQWSIGCAVVGFVIGGAVGAR